MRPSLANFSFIVVAFGTALIQGNFVTPGFEWLSDDYASYVHNAWALLSGGSYAIPGYVADLAMDAGPGAYPPGYPVLLMPGVAMFGSDLVALRMYNLVFAASCALLFMWWIRPIAGLGCTLATGVLVGLSPFFGVYKETLGSELACYSLLLLWLLVDRRFGATRPGWGGAVLTALPLAAGILTRLAVAPALVARPLADLWRDRRVSAAGLATPVVAVLLVGLGLWTITPEIIRHYVANISVNTGDQVKQSSFGDSVLLALLQQNLKVLVGNVSIVWSAAPLSEDPSLHVLDLVRKAVTLMMVGAGVAGLVMSFRRGPGTVDMFFVVQLGFLLVMPSKMTAPRLYVLLSLLVIYYAFMLASAFRPRRLMAAGVVGLLLAGSIPSWIGIAGLPPDRFTVYEPRAQAFLEWVRTSTPGDAVILTHKARAVSLFTGRGSSDWHHAQADADFMAWAARLRARYIVFYIDDPTALQLNKRGGAGDSEDALNRTLSGLIAEFFGPRVQDFELAFANERFRVFRLPSG